MFRRPLLGALNHIWEFIVSCEDYLPVVKFTLPQIFGSTPSGIHGLTASDASERGGVIKSSQGLSSFGAFASPCSIRGDVVEP